MSECVFNGFGAANISDKRKRYAVTGSTKFGHKQKIRKLVPSGNGAVIITLSNFVNEKEILSSK